MRARSFACPFAFVTEYPDVVRAVVSDVGIITDITGTQVQAVRCKALWDTGAVYSVISNAFAAKLRLQEFDRGRNYTAQGSYETSVYLLSIVLPNGIVVPDLRVSSGEFQDFDFLLGMDVILLGSRSNHGEMTIKAGAAEVAAPAVVI